MFFDSILKHAKVGNTRQTGAYLHYFIEGAKQLQSYPGELYHVISDYKDGDFAVGKELTTSYPISCTNDQQTIVQQATKHNTPYILKFVNAPNKVMPQVANVQTFNEAVVLPGCKVKVTNLFVSGGLNFIELTSLSNTWSDEHLLKPAKEAHN